MIGISVSFDKNLCCFSNETNETKHDTKYFQSKHSIYWNIQTGT